VGFTNGLSRLRRAVAVSVVVAVVLALAVTVGVAVWLAGPDDDRGPQAAVRTPAPAEETDPAVASPSPTASPSPSASPSATASPSPAAAGTPRSSCNEPGRDFRPRQITVEGVTRRAGVVRPPREAGGVPGVPPLSSYGKTVFAFDRAQGVRPGDPAGNVLLNAHTWPDGTALGNHLLAGLHRGDRIVVHGWHADLCYRVTERVEVLASDGLARYYDKDGPPQLAIVVCSGRRLGPGNWEKRTIWFASPRV
jgi:hypothetical protein